MLLPMLLAAAAAAGQAAPATADGSPVAVGPGRFFVSPMGEPFYGRTRGEDGLVVWFQQADSNRDGMITSAELKADADRFFAVLDRHKDGEIDPDDIDYYEGVLAPQMRARSIVTATVRPGGEIEEHFDNESASGQYGLLTIPQPVASADRNFNRGVSPDEFQSAAARRFQLLDSASSGSLSLAQLQVLRRAAAQVAKRKPQGQLDAPSNSRSAEHGGMRRPQR